MIKGAGKTPLGVPVLFLGLSGENVIRLSAGEPILIRETDMKALGMPQVRLIIHYGRTEEAIIEELKAHGMDTKPLLYSPEWCH